MQTLLSTSKVILERNLMNVMYVGKPLAIVVLLRCIKEFTLERDPINVRTSGNLSGSMHTWLITREFTLWSII